MPFPLSSRLPTPGSRAARNDSYCRSRRASSWAGSEGRARDKAARRCAMLIRRLLADAAGAGEEEAGSQWLGGKAVVELAGAE